jgi:hypothetical protein
MRAQSTVERLVGYAALRRVEDGARKFFISCVTRRPFECPTLRRAVADRRTFAGIHTGTDGCVPSGGPRENQGGDPVPRGSMVFNTAILLYGFALENLFKARVLEQGAKLVKNKKLQLPKALQSHNFPAMADHVA